VEILKRLRETMRRKWPEIWPKDWILHHNASAHKTLSGFRIMKTSKECDEGTESYCTAGVLVFQHWQHRSTKCTAAQAEYFEGDSSQ